MLSLFCFLAQAKDHQPTELSKGAVCVTEAILEGKKPQGKHLQKIALLYLLYFLWTIIT